MKDAAREVSRVIGGRLKHQRIMRGMTQEKLAEALNVSFQQVQKYEKGTNRVSVPTLLSIARILRVPAQTFFDGLEDKSAALPPAADIDSDTLRALATIKKENHLRVLRTVARALANENQEELS